MHTQTDTLSHMGSSSTWSLQL